MTLFLGSPQVSSFNGTTHDSRLCFDAQGKFPGIEVADAFASFTIHVGVVVQTKCRRCLLAREGLAAALCKGLKVPGIGAATRLRAAEPGHTCCDLPCTAASVSSRAVRDAPAEAPSLRYRYICAGHDRIAAAKIRS